MLIPTGKILIWTTKAFAVVLSILMFMFMFGDGFPDFSEMSPRKTILFICFTGILIGLNLIWRRPKAAAWTVAGSSAAFWLIEVIYTSTFWMHWFFLIYPLIAIMIFISFKYPVYELDLPTINKTKPKRKKTKKKSAKRRK